MFLRYVWELVRALLRGSLEDVQDAFEANQTV